MSDAAVGIGLLEIFSSGVVGSPFRLSLRSSLQGKTEFRTDGRCLPYGLVKEVETREVFLKSFVSFLDTDTMAVTVTVRSLAKKRTAVDLLCYGGDSPDRSKVQVTGAINQLWIEYFSKCLLVVGCPDVFYTAVRCRHITG